MSYLLLVEDDIWLAELYLDILQMEGGYKVVRASSAEAALEMLDQHKDIKLIILDIFLPSHNGIEFLHETRSYVDLNNIPIIILSSVNQKDFNMSKERWKHYGVIDYLYKPHTKPVDLLSKVKFHLAKVSEVA